MTVLNINYGHNQKLMETCQLLNEYAQYVAKVREYVKGMPIEEAVEKAVEYCITNGILAEFLRKNRAEAVAMSIFEYDEEKHLKSEREIAYNEGKIIGIAEGRTESQAVIVKNMFQKGIEIEQICVLCMLTPEAVRNILEN